MRRIVVGYHQRHICNTYRPALVVISKALAHQEYSLLQFVDSRRSVYSYTALAGPVERLPIGSKPSQALQLV
jgi:hypothetical protein